MPFKSWASIKAVLGYSCSASSAFLWSGVWWLLKTTKGNTGFAQTDRTGSFQAKSIVKRLNSARISSALSMALQSGMDYGRAFDMAAALVDGDEETKKKLLDSKEKMFEGESFSKVIKETADLFAPPCKDDHDRRKNWGGRSGTF